MTQFSLFYLFWGANKETLLKLKTKHSDPSTVASSLRCPSFPAWVAPPGVQHGTWLPQLVPRKLRDLVVCLPTKRVFHNHKKASKCFYESQQYQKKHDIFSIQKYSVWSIPNIQPFVIRKNDYLTILGEIRWQSSTKSWKHKGELLQNITPITFGFLVDIYNDIYIYIILRRGVLYLTYIRY